MLPLDLDTSEPYVPFVTSRHASRRVHEVRRRDSRRGGARQYVGRVLIRAGRALAR